MALVGALALAGVLALMYRASTLLLRPARARRDAGGTLTGMLPFAYNWPTAHPMKVIAPWPWKPADSSLGPVQIDDEIVAIDGTVLTWQSWGTAMAHVRAAGAGGRVSLCVRRPGESHDPMPVDVVLDREVRVPADLGLRFEDLHYRTQRGHDVRAWYLPCHNARAPTVIALHGMAASRQAMLLAFGSTLVARGFNVLLPDALAHGDSSGPDTDFVGIQEVQAAIEAVKRQPDSDPERIILVGHSYGAVKALVSAAAIPGIAAVVALASPLTVGQGIRVVATKLMGIPEPLVTLLTPFLSFWVRVRTGEWLGRADALQAARRLHCPLLVVQGTQDELWPSDTARALYDASQRPKELVIVPGVDHNGLLVAGPAFTDRFYQFLVQVSA
ncbi:MAG: hypothetical protein NVS4B2_04990 [Chloroflexota bacterium]